MIPSGTLATMTPIKKTAEDTNDTPWARDMMKNTAPIVDAPMDKRKTNRCISTASGVLSLSTAAASFAIRPISVRSPVRTTIPIALPSTAKVEKNTRFFVSMGLSLVHSTVRASGSDSPVSEALSTYKNWNGKRTTALWRLSKCS